MDKLASLHVDPYVLRWLSDYLCQCSQCVAVNGEISTSSKVISDVPQGSVLAPLLYSPQDGPGRYLAGFADLNCTCFGLLHWSLLVG